MKAHQIYPSQVQWNLVKFKIQLILAKQNIQILNITKIPVQFDSQYQNHLKIDGAINATLLSQQEVQLLRINNKRDVIFQSGYISNESITTKQKQMANDKPRRVLLFKLAIGKILTVYDSSFNNELTFNDGADSLYFASKQPQITIFNHQYKVKSPKQYCLQYDVQYKITHKPIFNPNRQICQYCKHNQAQLFCIDDKQFFCKICYQQIHRSKQKCNHQNQPISPFNSVPFCQVPVHNQLRKNKYCNQCQQLKCDICLQKDHNKNHQILEVHKMSKIFSQKQKMILGQIKGKLLSQIRNIQKKIQTINKEYEQKQRDLQQKFSSKIIKLRVQAKQKIANGVGIHVQLKRRYDQMLWVEKFIEHCQPNLMIQDNIKMKEAFSGYIQYHSLKDSYLKFDHLIKKIGNNQ